MKTKLLTAPAFALLLAATLSLASCGSNKTEADTNGMATDTTVTDSVAVYPDGSNSKSADTTKLNNDSIVAP